MKLTVTEPNHRDRQWFVWAHLDEQAPMSPESFIIGVGATRDEAVAAALVALEQCCAELQVSPEGRG